MTMIKYATKEDATSSKIKAGHPGYTAKELDQSYADWVKDHNGGTPEQFANEMKKYVKEFPDENFGDVDTWLESKKASKKTKQSTLNKVVANLLQKGWSEKQIKAHLLKRAGSIGNVVYNKRYVGEKGTPDEAIEISFQVSDRFRVGLTPDDTDGRLEAFASKLDGMFYEFFGDWY